MTFNHILSNDEIDALKEIVNIGMGQAGAALSEILNGFVTLKVPDLKLVKSQNLSQMLEKFTHENKTVNVVKQSFVDDIDGEILFVFAPISYEDLGELLGLNDSREICDKKKTELLLEMSNSLASACLMGLGSELNLNTELRPPALVCLEQPSNEIENIMFKGKAPKWSQTLLIEIDFLLSEMEFKCEIMIFISENSIAPLKKSINILLGD